MSNFSNGYAVAVLVNGELLDARMDGVIAIPFGVEYSIRLINKNRLRALAKVYIDGQNITEKGIIVDAYSSVNLERPLDKPVKFRFASTESKAAEEHGKAGPDTDGEKGLIKVEWRPEREIPPYGTGFLGATSTRLRKDFLPTNYTVSSSSSLRSNKTCCPPTTLMGKSGLSSDDSPVGAMAEMGFADTVQKTSGGIKLPYEDEKLTELQSGVTVEGSHSTQSFRYVTFDIDYSKPSTWVMVKLKGYIAEEGIPRQGTNYCPQCRTKTKKLSDRYCRHCGVQL